MFCKTCSSWSIISGLGPLFYFFAFLDSVQQFINSGAVFSGTVQNESELRHVAHAQALFELMADVAHGIVEAAEGFFRFMLGAFHVDKHPRALAVGSQQNFRDIA